MGDDNWMHLKDNKMVYGLMEWYLYECFFKLLKKEFCRLVLSQNKPH